MLEREQGSKTHGIPHALYVCLEVRGRVGINGKQTRWFQIMNVLKVNRWMLPRGGGAEPPGRGFQLACRWDLACPMGGAEGGPVAGMRAACVLSDCAPTFSRELRSGNGAFCSEGSPASRGHGTGPGSEGWAAAVAVVELGEETCICPQTHGLPDARAYGEGASQVCSLLCVTLHGLEAVPAAASGHSALAACRPPWVSRTVLLCDGTRSHGLMRCLRSCSVLSDCPCPLSPPALPQLCGSSRTSWGEGHS